MHFLGSLLLCWFLAFGCALGAATNTSTTYEFPAEYSLTGVFDGEGLSSWTVFIDKTNFRSRLVNMTLSYPTPTTNNWYYCDDSGWSVYIFSHAENGGCQPTTIFQPPFYYCGKTYASCADLYADNAHNNFPMAGIIQSGSLFSVDYSGNGRGMSCPPLPDGIYTYDKVTGTPLYTTPANITTTESVNQITYAFVDGDASSQVLPKLLIQAFYLFGSITSPIKYTYPYLSFDSPSTADVEGPLSDLCNLAPPFATPPSFGCGWFCLNTNGLLTVGSVVPLTGFKYSTATSLAPIISVQAAVPVSGQPNLALIFGDSDSGPRYGFYNLDTTDWSLITPSPSLVYDWDVVPTCTPDGASCYLLAVNLSGPEPVPLLMRIDFDLASLTASQPQLVANLDEIPDTINIFSFFVDDDNSTVFVLVGKYTTEEIIPYSTSNGRPSAPVVTIPSFGHEKVLLWDFVPATNTFFGLSTNSSNSILVQFSLDTQSYGPLSGLQLDQVPQDGFSFSSPAFTLSVDKLSPNLQQPIISYTVKADFPISLPFQVVYDLQASQLTWISTIYLDLGLQECSFAYSDYFQPSSK